MTRPIRVFALASLLTAGTAFAHTGVEDPNVRAWMAGMKTLAEHTKTLGLMVRGKTAHDAEAARAALAAIETHARDIPDLFETRATDPKSEAVEAIWSNWTDFVVKSDALAEAASAADPKSPETLRMSFGTIGAACKACHADYRE